MLKFVSVFLELLEFIKILNCERHIEISRQGEYDRDSEGEKERAPPPPRIGVTIWWERDLATANLQSQTGSCELYLGCLALARACWSLVAHERVCRHLLVYDELAAYANMCYHMLYIPLTDLSVVIAILYCPNKVEWSTLCGKSHPTTIKHLSSTR